MLGTRLRSDVQGLFLTESAKGAIRKVRLTIGTKTIALCYMLMSLTFRVVAGDYFPIQATTTWEFDYKNAFYHGNGGTELFGVMTWKVKSIEGHPSF